MNRLKPSRGGSDRSTTAGFLRVVPAVRRDDVHNASDQVTLTWLVTEATGSRREANDPGLFEAGRNSADALGGITLRTQKLRAVFYL
jgi:hypothetical protein